MCSGVSHLQGEDRRHGFVVTDNVLHVTSVIALRHFSPTGQPRNGAALPSTLSHVGRRGGSKTPEDPVGPSRFALLPTGAETQSE